MSKNRRWLLLVLACGCLLLSGCWDYRGLNNIDIVTGMAVDKDETTGLYHLTLEIVDTQTADGGKMEAKYVETDGATVFDALRNSKKRLINKLYGGNLQTLIISRQVAQNDGVSAILEELLRDGEPRETLSVAISQEETAREILQTKGLDSNIIAYEVHEMIEEDNEVTASTKNMPLYKAYNAVRGTGHALVLPAIRCIQNGEETVAEVNGIAVFKEDRLIGFQTPENTMYYLFIVNEVQSGSISFPYADAQESISMEIKGSSTKTKVSYADGQVHVRANIKLKLNVTEIKGQIDIVQAQQREALEARVAQVLSERLSAFFWEVQTQVGQDIFGLGGDLYRAQPDLWRMVKDQWETLFKEASFTVSIEADILTSGVLKNY